MLEAANAHGTFEFKCFDKNGHLLWQAKTPNIVVNVGKNLALDTYLAGAGYTVTGPYIGIISATSFSAVSVNDTMASHAGWLEAGNAHVPVYSGTRKTCAWSAASGGSKVFSAAAVFAFTGAGQAQGAFIVLGSGASSTIDNTSGVLYSAGALPGGPYTVSNGSTISITYTASL